ncbi:MAG: aminoglycoside phosphotransferase family protein [Erysipelotrichales bacterium]|nr:aminoglycoside phosphotransferase family protein [Erysipelotrichales bacterium]
MKNNKWLTEAEKEKINEYFDSFASTIFKQLETYVNKWELSNVSLIDYFSVSCLFYCLSEKYGEVVLKIVPNKFEVKTEINTLLIYQNKCFVKIYDYDLEAGVMLLERIVPGTGLRNLSLERRIEIFCQIFKDLHIKTLENVEFPYYQNWITNMLKFLKEQNEYSRFYFMLLKANEFYLELKKTYPENRLLHGDLHHDNILLGANDNYKVIDPKGVIANPIFDIGRFIHNELTEESSIQKIEFIIKIISKELTVPIVVLNKLLYIDVVLGNCWNIEDGKEIDYYAIEMIEALII